MNLGRGVGLNVSKSGISPSVRTRYGSLGTKGFSVRTGIPGLTYRQGFGRKSDGGLIVALILIVVALLPFLLQLAVVIARVLWVVGVWLIQLLIIAPFNLLCWLVQSLADYIASRMNRSGSSNALAPVPAAQAQPQQLTDRRDFQIVGTILLVIVGLAVFKLVNVPASDSGGSVAQLAGGQNGAAAQTTPSQPPTAASPRPRRKARKSHPPAPALPSDTATKTEPESSQPSAAAVLNTTTETPADVIAVVRAKDPQAAVRIQSFCANATVGTNDPTADAQKCAQSEADAWNRIVVENEFPQLDPAITKKCSEPPFPTDSYVAEEACAKYELHKDVPAGQ
jgi:hypothetical protein